MKVMTKFRAVLLVAVLVVSLGMGPCSSGVSLSLLRSSLNAAPALVNSYVASGIITQAVADGDIRDFTQAGSVAITLGEDLKSADTPLQKAEAGHRAANGWRAIVDARRLRGAKTAPKIEVVFATAEGVFLFIEAYYADRAGQAPRDGAPSVDGLSEDEFEEILKQRLKELKELVDGPK